MRPTEMSVPIAGGIGGLLGGIAFGLLMQIMMPEVITVAIPALFGLSGGLTGWGIHLINSVVFGLVFGLAVSLRPLREFADSRTTVGLVGLGYGAVVWVVAAGLVMPIWLAAVGFQGAPPLPNLTVMGLVGHLVYGLVLGLSYYTLRY